MIIKSRVAEPYLNKDGTWDVRTYEMEEEYPESAARHCELCTFCGFTAYPECRKWCPNEKLAAERMRKPKV